MLSYHPMAKTTYKIRKKIKENPKRLSQRLISKEI